MRGVKCYSISRGRHILRKVMARHETDLYTAFVFALNKAADSSTMRIVDYVQHVEMLEKAYSAMCDEGEE